jgi:hypothetical protein
MRLYIIDKIYLTALLRTQKEDYIATDGQQQGLILGGAGQSNIDDIHAVPQLRHTDAHTFVLSD